MLQYGIDFIHPTIFHSSTFPTVIPKIFSLLSTLKSDVLTDTTYQYNTLSIKHNIFDLNAISFAQNYNSQIFGFLEKVEQIGYSSDDLYLLDINLHHFTILQNISNVQTERTNRALFRLLYSFKILNIFSNYIDLFFKKNRATGSLIVSLNKKFLDFSHIKVENKNMLLQLQQFFIVSTPTLLSQDKLTHITYNTVVMTIMQTKSQRLYTGLKTLGEFRLKKRKPLEMTKICCHGTNYAGQKEPFLGQMISTTHLQMVGTVVNHKSYCKSQNLQISM
ncbi:Hypothetical_protein [Hexamita inflata]|uniref:Hypothetical_protein n=1 Tax=Hexamita inflata TaxID=28002 RepID=A0ABP1HPS6_9EUKA